MNSQRVSLLQLLARQHRAKFNCQTIFDELRRDLGTDQIGVINEDAYYRDQSHLSMDERVLTNYDHPKALDHQLLCTHLQLSVWRSC